jgi:hypothetical protein
MANEKAPYQQRVVYERDQLEDRLSKLNAFINASGSPSIFDSLPHDERARMSAQAHYMSQYLSVLNDRIAAFK